MLSTKQQNPKEIDFRRRPFSLRGESGDNGERSRIVLRPGSDTLLRRAILILSLACGFPFVMLLVFSYMNPIALEKWARKAIAHEVQKRVVTKIDGLENSALVWAAERKVAKNSQEIAESKSALAKELPSRIAVIMDRMMHPECPCRARAENYERAWLGDKIARLDQVNARMTSLIESKYHDVALSLLFELRVFSGANAAALFLLVLIAKMWKRPALQLLPPAIVLMGALALTANIYLFNQNWLQTILLGDYVGLFYIPYVLLAVGFMLDIVFLRAVLSVGVISMIGGALAVVMGALC